MITRGCLKDYITACTEKTAMLAIPVTSLSEYAISVTLAGNPGKCMLEAWAIDLISTLVLKWEYVDFQLPDGSFDSADAIRTVNKLPAQFTLQVKFGSNKDHKQSISAIGLNHLGRTKLNELHRETDEETQQYEVVESFACSRYRSGSSGGAVNEMTIAFNRLVIANELVELGADRLVVWEDVNTFEQIHHVIVKVDSSNNLHSITQPAEPQPNPHDKPVQVEEKFVNTWIPQKDQYVYIDDSEELHVLVDFDAFENAFFVIPADSARNERLQNMAVPAKRNAAGSNPTSYSTVGARRTIKVKGSQITPYVLEF